MLFFKFNVESTWELVVVEPQIMAVHHVNDIDHVKRLYTSHKSDIWLGYGNKEYDNYLLKACIQGVDPKLLHNYIHIAKQPGYNYDKNITTVPLNSYDMSVSGVSFRQACVYLGHEDYCVSLVKDLEYMVEIFYKVIDDFNVQLDLIKEFKLPLKYMVKTKAQLVALILGCTKQEHKESLRIGCEYTGRYSAVYEAFKNGTKVPQVTVGNTTLTFGDGGLHGAPDKPVHEHGLMLHIDGVSYFPALMINNNLLTRSATKGSLYKEIRDKRVELLNTDKRLAKAYKEVLVGANGIANDRTSTAYDPSSFKSVCVTGQLMMLKLIERFQDIPSVEILNANTDGIIVSLDERYYDELDLACEEWEREHNINLSFTNIKELHQANVNTYVYKSYEDKLVRKGDFVKHVTPFTNDCAVINNAIVNYLVNDIAIETTVNNAELIDFQMVIKCSDSYDAILCGAEYGEEVLRVFATIKGDKVYKIADDKKTRVYSNLDNAKSWSWDLQDLGCVTLDKQWYIDFAKKKLSDLFDIIA